MRKICSIGGCNGFNLFLTPALLFIIITICSFSNRCFSQTIIYTTDFGTVANVNPPGWTFAGIDMNISTNTSSSGYPGVSGGAYLGEGNSVAFVNTSGIPEAASQTGTSGAILQVNTTGFSTVTVAFGMRKSSAGYNANATYTLDWSPDGITYTIINYTEATAGGWGLASGPGLILPAGAANQPILYLRWTFVRTGNASNFKIDDFSVTGNGVAISNAPTIALDVAGTTNFLDGGVTIPPVSPFSISGVINDPTDPGSTLGLDFTIGDPQIPAGNLTVTATSGNTAVVPAGNLLITGNGATRNVKITPVSVGYSNINISVSNGTTSTSYLISYAASIASSTPPDTHWHTGMSDASDAIAIDNNFYISGDDELDILNVYSRSASGLPLVSYDYSSFLGLSAATSPEVDLEAGTPSPTNANKVYWMGSMSTGGSSFGIRPNRDRLFATTYSGTGAATTFSVVGYYASLRTQLVAWGDVNGYNFSASASAGVDSKNIAGFAAEGMVFGPDNTTLYVGLRAPLVPTANRTKAVIAPVTNFELWFNSGSPAGNPTIAPPIELNLGGRGIRDLVKLSNGTYIIIAGNPAGSPITSAVYKWTGNAADAPILVPTSASGVLNLEGVMQINMGSQLSVNQLQVISDGGDEVLYNDNISAKDFATLNFRKFRSDNLSSLDLCMPDAVLTPTITQTGMSLSSTQASTYQWYFNNTPINGATSQNYNATQNGIYYVVTANMDGCTASSATAEVIGVGIPEHFIGKGAIAVFPNPYNESTSIQLTLSENSTVTIEVYSLLGQQIQVITNGKYTEGTYMFTFGAKKSGSSPGVYLLKTTVNENMSVTRIIENN